MTAFLHTLLTMSLTASFVAVIVFLLRLILKGRAARQTVCLLWLLVFARLLIPVTLQSPVSLIPDMELSDPAPVVSEAPEAVPTLPANTSPIATIPPNVSAPAVTFPVQNPVVTIPPNVSAPAPMVSAPVAEEPPAAEPPVIGEPTPFPWETVLTVVWAVGVAAMLIYGLSSYLSIRRKLRFAIRTREGWWEDPHLRSPFILGLARPKIYLPCHMTPYARRFILCHEQAHIRRGDHIVKPICWLALAIHWFNPLAWAAFLLLSRDIEVACDEKVLRELGQEVKADYSATLLALATNGRFPAPTPLAFGEGDAKTRIKSVLNFKKPTLWVTVAAIVVAIVAAVCLLTDPVDKFDPDEYITYDCYPGLYFTERYSEDTAITMTMAYRLEKGKPVLVAGWQDHPADNVSTLIYPTPNREEFTSSTPILGPVRETTARYEQYLVDYMMAQDESWAQRYIEEAGDLFTVLSVSSSDLQSSGQIGDLGAFQGGIAYTLEENLLFCWEGTAQVLPRWTPLSPDAHTVKVYPYDRAEDGTDRLDILWTGKDITLLTSSQPGLQTYTDDALITYIWDDETWTAHNAADTIAFTDKPVSFDAEQQVITVTYDPNAYTNGDPDIAHIDPGMIHRPFPIPEDLGRVQSVSVSESAYIARREDGDYDLTYGVYAMPESGDPVRVVELTAILKWNALTEQFEITFTGAEAVGGSSAAPEESQLLAELPEYGLSLYRQSGSWRPILQYGEHLMELNTAIEIERSPVQFFPGDRNNDGITEIVILYHKGWGTGSDKYGLMACWADGDGLHVEEHDFADLMEEFNQNNSFAYDREGNALSLTYHGQTHRIPLDDFLSSLNWDAPDTGVRVTGELVGYSSNEDGTFTLSLTPGIYDGYPMLNYLRAELRAAVRFDGERFHTGEAALTNLSAAVIGSLPGEDVSLCTNGEGSFWLNAYGHYGPVTILNDLAKSLDTDTLADLRKATADNLSGPDFEYISFTMRNKYSTVPHTYDLIWSEESGSWEQFPYTSPLSSLPRDMVTPETMPTDPEWYYKVAESQSYSLYARNWGGEIMLTWGNFFWEFDHVAHTGHMNLPVMEELDDGTVAVISEVNTGTGVGVDELVVYRTQFDRPVQNSHYTTIQDYLYDWRDLAADFNRNNTLTYDKLSNSLTLSWNGKTYSSGRLASDLSVGFDLEDGFTGALIATGELVRYTSNGDGTFTIRIDTAIGRGNKGGFHNEGEEWFWRAVDQDNHYFPMSTGITGLDLVWTVKFTGEGFEVVEPLAIHTPATLPEGASLVISLPDAGLYIYTPRPTAQDAMEHLVFYEGRSHRFPRFGDGISDLRLSDLDGDGTQEICVTGWFGMGGTYGDVLTVLKWNGFQWKDYRLSTVQEGDLPAEFRSSAARITGSSGDTVTMELAGLTHELTVSTMLVEQSGTFRLSDTGCPYSVFWFDGQPWLRLQGRLYKTGTGLPSSYCNTGYELLVRPDFKSDGTFELVPMSLYTLCASLSPSPAELREGEYAQYGESDLLLVDFLPESGTYLYRDTDGQLWLRDGARFAPLNAELYNYSRGGVTLSLVSSKEGEVTLHVVIGATGAETDVVFILSEVYSESDGATSAVWLPNVSMIPRF